MYELGLTLGSVLPAAALFGGIINWISEKVKDL